MNAEKKKVTLRTFNKTHLDVLTETLDPDTLHNRVSRLEGIAEARVAHKNIVDTMRGLGKFNNVDMHYIAQIDQSVWSAVLQVFARHDPETGELIDDGLLYKNDPEKGCLVLNKDFFFALLDGPLKNYDMRGKNKLMF